MFPNTPKTLLKKIAELAQGDDRAEWAAFVELYTPVLHQFVHQLDSNLSDADIDDVVQDVFIKLVDVLRNGVINRSKAKFRAYLATMARHTVIDRYRASCARLPQPATDTSEPIASNPLGAGMPPLEPGAALDIQWRMAVRAAAEDHVMTQTAVSERSKTIYTLLAAGKSQHEVAQRLNVSHDVVKQVKSRMERAIAALEQHLLQ